MPYRIELERVAVKALQEIPQRDRVRIISAIEALKEDPRPPGAVKLAGSPGWRIRVGDYRIIYLVEDAVQIVTVTRIGHRRDIYKRAKRGGGR